MMEQKIEPGQLWRHYKGGLYRIVALAQNNQTDDLYDMVVYEDTTAPKVWTQSLARFVETVTWEGKQVKRFERTSD